MRSRPWPLFASLTVFFLSFLSPAFAQYPPVVEQVRPTDHGALPPDTKVTCIPSPNTGAPSPTCPILKISGYSYWAYSYSDNRVAMAIAAYDANGRLVRQWERPGARYIWKIDLDNDKQTVSFVGQVSNKIVMTWQELAIGVEPGALAVENVGTQAINCLFSAGCAAVAPTDSVANISAAPDITGTARLQTRTFVGAPGTAAAGKTAYQYRVDLSQAVSSAEVPCVTDVTIDIGPTVQLNYDGTGTPGDAYVVAQGGLGTIGIFSAVKTGNKVTFTFNQPVCAGASGGTGQSSQFFGVTSASAPKAVTAKAGWPGTVGLDVGARAPAY